VGTGLLLGEVLDGDEDGGGFAVSEGVTGDELTPDGTVGLGPISESGGLKVGGLF
jgi:hypothetical protein